MTNVARCFDELFEIKCKSCGSTDVRIDYEEGHVYSEYTSESGFLAFECNACRKRHDVSPYEV